MKFGGHPLNAQRIRKHFAFLPKTIHGETIWLEVIEYLQEWYCPDSMWGYRWVDQCFIGDHNRKKYSKDV